jgi:hypothetical protein
VSPLLWAAWVTVTVLVVLPLTKVTVAVRAVLPTLAWAVSVRVPLPDPLTALSVSQVWLLEAVQLLLAITATLLLPAVAAKETEVGFTERLLWVS